MSPATLDSTLSTAGSHGLGASALRALLFLYQRRDRITIVTDLARQLKRTTAATTGTCDRLVKKGFITRTHTDEDRRKLILTITSEGITALKSILSK